MLELQDFIVKIWGKIVVSIFGYINITLTYIEILLRNFLDVSMCEI